MLQRLLSLTVASWLACGILQAQEFKISKIHSLSFGEQEICLALLPDSTMLISVYKEGRPRCFQMALKDTTWVKIDSQLADLITGLMPSSLFEPHFKFSDDFTHLILTLQQDGSPTYYESIKENGEWGLFTRIDIDPKLLIWHGIAISSDYSKLFGRSADGGLYQFDRDGESWSKGTRLAIFDQVTQGKELVQDVMTVGANGLVVQLQFESSKEERKEFQKKYGLSNGSLQQGYFFCRLQPNGKWTAPTIISDMYPMADNVVLSPWGDCMLFSIGAFGKMSVPKVIQDEIASQKNILTKAVGEFGIQWIYSTPGNDWCAAMLPDSTMLVSSCDKGQCNVSQLVRKGNRWEKVESHLASMINRLSPVSGSNLFFRFTEDFRRVVVTIEQPGLNRFFESKEVNGEWGLFTEIPIDPVLKIRGPLAISSDHSRLFGVSGDGRLYVFNREGESWSPGTSVDAFDNLTPAKEFIDQVLTIGAHGLLVRSSFETTKDDKKAHRNKFGPSAFGDKHSYFYSRMEMVGKWTAPVEMTDIHPSAERLALAPSRDRILFAGEGNIGVMDVPKFLKKELEASGPALASRDVPPAAAAVEIKLDKPKAVDGKYYALLIGNADYQEDKLDLTKPAIDVATLSKTLTSHYQFDQSNITTLINGNRNAIFKALQDLRAKITRKDNVLIFYAGHGQWDEVVKQGYWLPVDAEQNNPANWLSNSDLREQISAINSAHTLLISDACFSGALFKQRSLDELRTASFDTQQLYRLRSRRAMTSGTVQVVPDDSPFIKYLVQFLNENPDRFLSSGELFTRMRKSVMNNGMTVPQEGVIMNTGDEGGDFIFIRR